MASTHAQVHEFIPAAGRNSLLRLYDPLTRLFGIAAMHDALIAQASLTPGLAVLDVGCGTGSLAVRICGLHPGVSVAALDPDANALAIGRRKAERAGVNVRFEQGYADALPFADVSVDRVTSSLMFHHLSATTQRAMLAEVFRVLRPGGSLHLMDFGSDGHRHDGLLARLLHRDHQLHGGDDAQIAAMIEDAGFAAVELCSARKSSLGRVAFHRATKPKPS